MKTFDEQKAFFDEHEEAIQRAAKGGAGDVLELIQSFEDPLERRVLYVFVRQALFLDREFARDLDVYVQVAQAGIDECLAQAKAESDPEDAAKRTDTANVIAYNLAADLADCWPADGLVREERHFQVGFDTAERCIAWREELGKPPHPRSIAYWVKGMHELSLGRPDGALDSFRTSTDFARQAATADGLDADACEEAFGVLLGRGYEAIALAVLGDADADGVWNDVESRFKAQLDDEAKKSDAEFGLTQLATVRERYWPDAA
ncbi:MAG: hypothetical protein H6832_12875 [Planctomycetes bacterium]|nr:hypothetical protein [Planctomycetota bacterium]